MIFVEGDPPKPALLRLVESLVCPFQNIRKMVVLRLALRYSYGKANFHSFREYFPFKGLQYPLSLVDGFKELSFRHHNHKFISTVADKSICASFVPGKNIGNSSDNAVTLKVSEYIVNQLEVINVYYCERPCLIDYV